MVIDFHTHTFPEKIAFQALDKLKKASHTEAFTDGTVNGLTASMRRAGIDACVVLPVATNSRQVPHVNDSSIAINSRAAETGIYSLGCMHPEFENYASELKRLKDAGIRGIKLHPVYQGVDIDDIRYLRILERCAALDMLVLIHAGLDVGFPGETQAVPQKVLSAVKQVPGVKLILAHMGGWRCWDEATELLSGRGLYIDTAFSIGQMLPLDDGYYKSEAELELLTPEKAVSVIRAFDAEHTLFGTDSPWDDQASALNTLRSLPLSGDELDGILHLNARKLLGI